MDRSNPLLAMLAADDAAMQAAADSYQPGYDHAQASDLADLGYGHLSHRQLAGMVRMLMRDSLCHEPVLTAARDRIAWLAKRVEVLEATLPASVGVTRQLEMIAHAYVSEPGCLAVTERKIEEARAVLKAAGVDPDGGA